MLMGSFEQSAYGAELSSPLDCPFRWSEAGKSICRLRYEESRKKWQQPKPCQNYKEFPGWCPLWAGITQEFLGNDVGCISIDEKTTLVKAKALSGFKFYETSSCVDPNNYNEEIGRNICTDRIIDKIWDHLGFVLQWAKDGLGQR